MNKQLVDPCEHTSSTSHQTNPSFSHRPMYTIILLTKLQYATTLTTNLI